MGGGYRTSRPVRDPRVLAAMREVPRDRFLPPSLAEQAYDDNPLPIGRGQTISQPYIVAYMSELLAVEPQHRVLEVGTGSGYQAALLSLLARRVYSIERIRPLAEAARRRLAELGYDNVEVRYGDGFEGWPEEAPFDRILVTAAPKTLPEALVEQLAPGGRLVAPVGGFEDAQTLIVVEKDEDGNVRRREDLPVRFVPMLPETEV
ncbi:MAG: protein-L-isoaspartate(D-aspartate) O-methyltransferase [Acidobacteria bacterium]|nr:protein-L-isoaspartate(D-aspartate) O-methyltransferase [Acidobacteriota bacterium]